jgi:hypothetical protein
MAASENGLGPLWVESAISDFSGADARIGNADYLFIRPPAAGMSAWRRGNCVVGAFGLPMVQTTHQFIGRIAI